MKPMGGSIVLKWGRKFCDPSYHAIPEMLALTSSRGVPAHTKF